MSVSGCTVEDAGEVCGAIVEYRCEALDQGGEVIGGGIQLACGDGEHLLKAVAGLFAHQREINGVVIYEWVTS